MITGNRRASGPPETFGNRPRRLQRTRRRNAFTPAGAIYVGRPTLWSNPFAGRPHIGHARSVILYRAWLADDLTPRILAAAGFGMDEIRTLARWRRRLLKALPRIAGKNLQCWCPTTSSWCHADVLLALANGATAE
ncbi:DUF4326 domain-containing protein [Stakelama tenebrarum]|uniref:DUF4326 domain-containing protein n=1 Tax=Stakelama tenebrarum TaxID=2711215 RepID=A0A6G6YBC5_9SPHN|nr:DUF4326 domain-containing protein [Sphingosinithalassobacter tenebrarum]QIG81883.1 DUF4326 domain-containing protein [Sphingosinithalassobacter tenebrarum]